MHLRRAFLLTATLSLLSLGCEGEISQTDSTGAQDPEPRAADRDCGLAAGVVQIEGGVGVLRTGTPVDVVRARCQVVRDTVVLDTEGMPARELRVALHGDTVIVEVVADSVWRVRLSSPRFRVGEGLGVGTAVSALAAMPGARALVGEGAIYVTVPATCGVSYRIAGADVARVAGVRSPERAMRMLPDTLRVDRILVMGCPDVPEG